MAKQIPLTQGKFALVDDEDFEFLNQLKWRAHKGTNTESSYAVRTDKSSGTPVEIYMHRKVLNAPQGFEVDHIDGNRLNNQKQNLRIASHYQNSLNRGVFKNNTSGCAGVSFQKSRNKFTAFITVKGKKVFLGRFKNFCDAVIARQKAEDKYFGNFRRVLKT